ncbi:MAG: TetR/AcrR family transcriptional regulator [Lachnospiraceae bacterium]|nr:TetR/AcrR family transcriptional regulator [Lachnospiraceae bacterium]
MTGFETNDILQYVTKNKKRSHTVFVLNGEMYKPVNSDERIQIREKIIEAALELIKQLGVTHTSVSRITEQVGIGKGTFYHYFASKEELIYVLMEKQAEESGQDFLRRLHGREKMSVEEGKAFLRYIIERDSIIYGYMTDADMKKMEKILGAEKYRRISLEEDPFSGVKAYLSHVEGVRQDIDIKVFGRLVSAAGFVHQHWNEYPHLVEREDIYKTLLNHIYDYIFAE